MCCAQDDRLEYMLALRMTGLDLRVEQYWFVAGPGPVRSSNRTGFAGVFSIIARPVLLAV